MFKNFQTSLNLAFGTVIIYDRDGGLESLARVFRWQNCILLLFIKRNWSFLVKTPGTWLEQLIMIRNTQGKQILH